MTFVAELKQRKLVQWSLAYVAAAFALIQVTDVVAQQFGWPDGVRRAITIALAVGFFITLVLAWYHGERGAQRVSGTELLFLALLLMIGGGLLWRVVETGSESLSAANTNAHVPAHQSEKDSDPIPPPAKSIAVLPFTDLSPTHDQEYFSDGIAEEILNALTRIKDLKVAGRTSSFQFKGKNEDLRSIGKALAVAHVLEGSVRKQGDKVRITAQLIQAEDGYHLWSQSYDGDLSDVFELQERIARAITDQLQVVLQGEQKTRLVPIATSNPEAYTLYLQASAIFNRRDGLHYADAIAALQQAIRLDPKFARAHSRLAALYVVIVNNIDVNLQATHDLVLQHARSASVLDPTLAEPYAAEGFSDGKFPQRLIEQRKAFDRALELDAEDVTTNFWFGLSLVKTGYRARGIALIDHALALDPMLPNALRWRGILYFDGGDLEQAEQLLKRARDLGLPFADRNLADVVSAHGDNVTAAKLFASGSNQIFPGLSLESLDVIAAGIYGDARARARALVVIDAYLAQPHEHIPGMLPVELYKLGEPARALTVMHKQLTADTTDFLVLLWSPQGREMRALPEFSAFLRDFGFVALWDQYGAPDGCRKNPGGDYVCA